MTPTTAPSVDAPIDVSAPGPARPPWRLSGWPPLLVALGCAAAYAVFFWLPARVNGLDGVPLEELYLHDPMHLWPYDRDALSVPFGVGAMVTLGLGPVVALGTLGWAAAGACRGVVSHHGRRAALSALAAVVALGVFVWPMTPLGSRLVLWFLD